jgi:hypothetical protein
VRENARQKFSRYFFELSLFFMARIFVLKVSATFFGVIDFFGARKRAAEVLALFF